MQLKSIVVVSALALGVVSVFPSFVARARGGPVEDRKIDEILESVAKAIVVAKDEEAVVKARKKAINEYQFSKSGYSYARMAATRLTPLLGAELKATDPLRVLKVVNVAMALSRMPQVTIQPALEAMVVHANPAVRLLGWTAYFRTRNRLMSQGEAFAAKMHAALDKAGLTENSPPVLAAMFRMMETGAAPAGVPVAVWQKARAYWLTTLRRNWRRWCGKMAAGEAEMARASEILVRVAQSHAGAAIAGEKDPKKLKARKGPFAQMVYDVAWSASKAYQKAHGDPEGDARLVAESGALLRDCERALNALAGTEHNFIISALVKGDDRDRATRVRLAVLRWEDVLKKDYGVTEPEFGKPTTKPTTAPAAK